MPSEQSKRPSLIVKINMTARLEETMKDLIEKRKLLDSEIEASRASSAKKARLSTDGVSGEGEHLEKVESTLEVESKQNDDTDLSEKEDVQSEQSDSDEFCNGTGSEETTKEDIIQIDSDTDYDDFIDEEEDDDEIIIIDEEEWDGDDDDLIMEDDSDDDYDDELDDEYAVELDSDDTDDFSNDDG